MMETDRIRLRPWREGEVMQKCGFTDTVREVLCPNLEVGSDKPVKVMKRAFSPA